MVVEYIMSDNITILNCKYEVRIELKDGNNEPYYKKSFTNYDDALDKCNIEFHKLTEKNLYKKSINLIKLKNGKNVEVL